MEDSYDIENSKVWAEVKESSNIKFNKNLFCEVAANFPGSCTDEMLEENFFCILKKCTRRAKSSN